ncbi:MAG TPA: TonB-dependent receptor [Blastocatellia bacterium]|nr:TonB-dependent receptor [Blastocatellia bacterium]HMV85181.1 TonB-dependent receptor [Blastocatellia bacterium]HMX24806.1 TonB-dependent receptor [Blastocatellia bacterium]HMZ18452.1 TonB-dependent receptor [Blastocatellia bacterium]HNG28715.1 TonB-dependent receptor [Blastocatellia bacterium]
MKPRSSSSGILRVLSSSILLLLVTVFAFAQENTGAVQGTVKDTAGASIPGAKVTLSGPMLVRTLEATSDKEGAYSFPKVPSGIYTVTVTQNGFKTVKNEDVNVVLGQAARVDVSLAAGAVTESVTISASSEVIDVTSSKAATNIVPEFVDKTPKGRQFHSLLVVAPGVRPEPKSGSFGVGGFQINGASGSENTFVVDGVDVSDVRRGALRGNDSLPFEFVQEVQVKTAGFEAEYSGTLGGVVNVVSRSGSNEFHGDVWLQMNGAALNSAPRGTWRRTTADVTKNEFFRAREDEYRTFYPGFTLGGPIIKERLNFFTGYTADLARTERTIPFAVGTRTTTSRVVSHRGVARVDYAPTQKLQINTSYFWNPVKQTGQLSGNDPSVAPPNTDFSTRGGYTPASNYTASATYTVKSNLILEARYGYKYLNDKNGNYGLAASPWYIWNASTAPGTGGAAPSIVSQGKITQAQYDAIPVAFRQANGFQNVANTFGIVRDITTRHNVYLNANYIANIEGQRHSFKGGYALNRLNNNVLDDYTQGRFEIVWGEAISRGSIQNVRGTYGYYIWRDGVRHNAQVSSRNQGYYIQDSWQVLKNLTINAGVRLENEFLPPYTKVVNGNKVPNPISFGWGDKVAPLVGGAWDVLGNGKWKVSASYGQYFDLMKYELARGSFGGDYWHDHYYRLNDPDLSKLSLANVSALAGGTAKVLDVDNRTVPINAQGQLDGIDPDIKPMSSRQYSVGLDHELKPGMLFSARYTRSRLVRGIEDIGVLDAESNEVYTIGNPGFGATDAKKFVTANGVPLTPKAVRNFDGIEFRLDGRFSEGLLRRLNYNASYTYSRLWGNWGGLANSDENGRSDPNVSRAFDLSPGNFDSKGQNVFGLLATDRPHTFKLFLNYSQPWGGKSGETLFSINQIAYSGTPLTSTVGFIVPVFYNGRGDLGRTPALTQTDFLIAHTVNLSERVKMKFEANVTNLFNQAAVTNTDQAFNRNGSLSLTDPEFYKGGWDVNKLVNPVNGGAPAKNINYGFATTYQGIRDVRLGMRLQF